MLRGGEDALGSSRPDGGAGGRDVGEDGGAEEHCCGIIGPLIVVDAGAVCVVVGTVVDVVVAVYQPDARHPVICLLGPVAVGAVSRIASQARGELEEGAVGDGGFVVEAGVVGIELPL